MSKVEYFFDLNYSLANEDTAFERSIIIDQKPQKVLSVCGSGSRCFPLLHPGLKELHIVDLSSQQIYLAMLREEVIKNLDHHEFLKFWGYSPFRVEDNKQWRKKIFESLELGVNERTYLSSLFEQLDWQSPLYHGKWERTFIFFSKIVRKVVGEKNVQKLFSFENLEQQKDYVQKKFPRIRWMIILSILGNKAMFNALLYKGDFIKKNINESYIRYYSNAFNHLMTENLARESFFLQLCFFGEIKYSEGNLIEAKKECFDMMKDSLKKCRVHYHHNDLLSEIEKHTDLDFISLSDVPSYFAGDIEEQFIQKIRSSLNKNSTIINRNYLRIPNADRRYFNDIGEKFSIEMRNEGVQMYRIEVLRNE
jgi:S-adenosylmethionine-diacylglycerol 3-amino-3-carboxypropyl transferase